MRGSDESIYGGLLDTSSSNLTKQQFIDQTFRYVSYTMLTAIASVSAAILVGFPVLGLWGTLLLQMPPLLATLYYSYKKNDRVSFISLLLFAGAVGISIGPLLALISATIANGNIIILTSVLATALEVGAIWFYAWYKAKFSDQELSCFGSFISAALVGMLIVGIANLIFPFGSTALLLYSLAGVGLFSLIFTYDLYLLREGKFGDSPQLAAVNIFLDIVNLFMYTLSALLALNSDDPSAAFAPAAEVLSRLAPIFIVLASILTIGYFEGWWHKDRNENADSPRLTGPGQNQAGIFHHSPPSYPDKHRQPSQPTVKV